LDRSGLTVLEEDYRSRAEKAQEKQKEQMPHGSQRKKQALRKKAIQSERGI
jgi:hypothetical protein